MQSPLRAAQAAGTSPPGVEDQSPNRSSGLSRFSSGQIRVFSSSPVRGVNPLVDDVPPSPEKRPRGANGLAVSPVFGCAGEGRRSSRSHSPTGLSPRRESPLSGKLRTPSPVQWKVGSYSPGRKSKSWLGFQRAAGVKMEGQRVGTVKSLSVPDLIVCLDDSRLGFKLRPLPFASRFLIVLSAFQGSGGKGRNVSSEAAAAARM